MIREQDVREAIAEMQGQKNPNANTCIKLAAFYTILDHITEKPMQEPHRTEGEQYSYSGADPDSVVIDGDSEFAKAIQGRKQGDIWPVIDELMTTIQVIHPRLYTGVMCKLK